MSWWNKSESDDSELFTSSEEEGNEAPVEQGMGPNRFLGGDDSDDDEEKRVVLTAKEKRFEELKKSVTKIRSFVRLRDWKEIGETWNQILKDLEKGKTVIDKHGVPKFFISCLCALNLFIDKTWDDKEGKKNMKPQTSQAFTKMRSKFKKYLKDDKERGFLEKMEEFTATGRAFEILSESGESEEDSEVSAGEPDFTEASDEDKLTDLEGEKWNQEKVDKKIKDLLSKRGTKNYNKREHLKIFRFLRTRCEGLNNKLIIDFHIVTLLFDMTHTGVAMLTTYWKKVYNILTSVVETLIKEPTLKLYESREELLEDVKDDGHKLPSHVVTGVLIYSLERLGDEYNQSLQNIEAPSEQYLDRLSHENPLIRLLQLCQNFYLSHNDYKRAAVVAGRQLSYMYYRQEVSEEEKQKYIERAKRLAAEQKEAKASAPVATTTTTTSTTSTKDEKESGEDDDEDDDEEEDDGEEEEEKQDIMILTEEVDEELEPPASVLDIFNLQEVVPKLVNFVSEYAEERVKFRSIIQLIHHLALHDKFTEARDLLFMTHLQDKITKVKPPFQVLFNRALVQLGLAAFRQGRIVDTHNCLQEIVSSNRNKIEELLAQGINTNRYQVEKTKDQSKQESRRQIPYHMRFNLELLESVYLVAAMLLEIPNTAQSAHKDKKKIVSKHFQKCLEARERNPFNGPAENNRDIILASSKLLQQGNWKKCRDDILNLPIWQVMRNNAGVNENLSREIQEQGLRTYLLTYGQYYVSLSLNDLCSLFELSEGDVRGIINKMIINEEFYASWDQLSDSVIVNCVEPSKLQSWALNYADKMNAFLESGESSEQRPVFERKWDNQQQQGSQGGRYGTKNFKPGTPQYRTNVFVTRDKKGKTRPVGSREDSSNQYRQRKY